MNSQRNIGSTGSVCGRQEKRTGNKVRRQVGKTFFSTFLKKSWFPISHTSNSESEDDSELTAASAILLFLSSPCGVAAFC